MTPEVPPLRTLPDPVHQTLTDFEKNFSLSFCVRVRETGTLLYASPGLADEGQGECPGVSVGLNPRGGALLDLFIQGMNSHEEEHLPGLVAAVLERAFEFSQEVRFFTYKLSERYEEINLLYSISETLGSLLSLEEAAKMAADEAVARANEAIARAEEAEMRANERERIAAEKERIAEEKAREADEMFQKSMMK
mgnify:CR=1 FL=1